jgi:hypothetical protein
VGRRNIGAMTTDNRDDSARRQFRGILVRVLAVQVVALLLLWLLQARYAAS